MTVAKSASETTPTTNHKGRERDFIPRRLLPIAEFFKAETSKNDAEIEELMVITLAGMREGVIPADVGQEQLYHLFNIFFSNADMKSVSKSLTESIMEVPLLEVEAILRGRTEAKTKRLNGAKSK